MQKAEIFDLEKIIEKCIQKNFNSGNNVSKSYVLNNIQSYVQAWQGLVNWTKVQIEQDRTVNIPNFGGISYRFDPNIKEKSVIIQFSESLLKLSNLQHINDFSDFSYPSVKLNLVAIAQLTKIEQNNLATIISNIFQEIINIFVNYQQSILDLGFFGRIQIQNGYIEVFNQKPKSRGLKHQRPTVKGAQDKNTNLPNINHQQMQQKMTRSITKQDRQSGEEQIIQEKLQQFNQQKNINSQRFSANPSGRPVGMNRPQPKSRGQIEQQQQQNRGMRSVTYQQGNQNQRSPTRRFLKPDNSYIDSDMLGAGTDPMAKEGQFSLLANKASNLINAHFIKPDQMRIRYPPVLDKFSRTIGSPVSEMKYNLNPSGRIGSNFTPTAKLFYLDQFEKCVKVVRLTNIINFKANSEYLKVPATLEEELLFQVHKIQNPELEEKVRSKKICYERYKRYYEQEINKDQVAPIRQYWINDILDLIPGEFEYLSQEYTEKAIDNMLAEIGEYYYNSIRKSILDYVLKNDDEKLRLGIMEIIDPLTDYGSNIYTGIEPDTNWKNSVIFAREEMYDKLVICNDATLEIQAKWYDLLKNDLQLLNLPEQGQQEQTISDFISEQTDRIEDCRQIIADEFCAKNVFEIYKKVLVELEDEEHYAILFFESTSVLLSNLFRTHITNYLNKYKKFFERFDKQVNRPPTVIIEEEEINMLESTIEDSFLMIQLQDNKREGIIDFEDPLGEVQETLLKILDDLINITHKIVRPEQKLVKIDKQFLIEIPDDDETYYNTVIYVEQVVSKNLQNVNESLKIYNEYSFILNEAEVVQQFIDSKPDRKQYQKQIQKYQDLYVEVRKNCPFFIRMNMIFVDSIKVKKLLLSTIEQLIEMLQEGINTCIVKLNQELTKQIATLSEKISKTVDSTKTLVDLEQQTDQIRNIEEKNLVTKYKEVCSWLQFQLTLQRRISEQEIQVVYQTQKLIKTLMDKVEDEDDRLKREREIIENKLKEDIIQFNKQINGFQVDIEELESVHTKYAASETNQKIKVFKERLNEMIKQKAEINEDEVLLGLEEQEFPSLSKSANYLKPYEDLWILVQNVEVYHSAWSKENLSKLDPEFVERENKKMIQTAQKLEQIFSNNLNDKKMKKKTGKSQQVKDLVKDTMKEILEFKQNVPIIQCLCNPGLKGRHWNEILELLGKPDIKDELYSINVFVKNFNIGQHYEQLEEISNKASKEFGIEKILSKMRQDWKIVNIEQKIWKETGTHIIQGTSIEEIQQILDDQIVKTQTMKASPFAIQFKTAIDEWESFLNFTFKFSEILVKVQGTWIYLEPIFSSPDIIKRLPYEGKKFNNVDAEWKSLMDFINQKPQVLEFTKERNILDKLNNCQDNLEIVIKGLNAYLEGKRAGFPRFYFLSNDELLEILSETKDPLKVQPHLKKCFEGIQKLEFDNEKQVLGMYSSEKEQVKFLEPIDTAKAQGNVEEWLQQTEEYMIDAVHQVIAQAQEEYINMKRDEWVVNRCGQAVLCMSMTYWTSETEQAIDKGGSGLKDHLSYLTQCIDDIVEIVRSDISKLDRCTIEALIVLDVHNKDVVVQLVEQQIEKVNDFLWKSQLRYYWEQNETVVRIINAVVEYNYEYLGNSSRLVITPLTDRCYRTLCGAVHLNYGGAPEGPAGTGKTETVKDLAKALARQCVVFNCSDGLDYKAMAKFFKGLASSGAWSCFDEFNRIDLEVLSVIAQQILTIQLARERKVTKFLFEDSEIPLKATCNVFITMNPGYAGRSELPDNLKALFRTVAMMVPDYAMIAEIVLYSFGFSDARRLARKIVTTYTLCSEQLSSQDHYDYGMRAVKSVLTAAGNLKRKFPKESESVLMLRAINEVNLAKFLAYDIPLFKGITSDLFQKVIIPEIDYQNMYDAIDESLKENNLQNVPYFREKTIQLYEMILVRHGLMVVGQPFSGKSSSIKILQQSLGKLKERNQMNEEKTNVTIINPKSIPMKFLYGYNDEVSQDWSDGVLAVKFRNFSKSEDSERKWLVFDGPVDAIWIENMNTVLDDNKKLCLMSGEIIQMSNTMNLIFEPMDLAVASPATVSRCGMIFMEPHLMGWQPIYDSWKQTLPQGMGENEIAELDLLFGFMIDAGLNFIRNNCQEISVTQDQNLVQSLLRILGYLLKDYENLEYSKQFSDIKQLQQDICNKFMFSYIWSLGGSLQTQYRKPFDIFTKRLANGDIQLDESILKKKINLPERGQLFDYKLHQITQGKPKEWVKWLDTIEQEKIPDKSQVQKILVETQDTIRYTYILEIHIQSELPLLFCGPTGTGKTVYIKNTLNKLDPANYLNLEIGFSAQTTCTQTQDIIDGRLERKRKGIFGPKIGKCVLFVDDLNMPQMESYGAQPPIEILRQFLDQGGWYDNKDKEKPFKRFVDTTLVAAQGPPGGGRTFITPRILRHFTLTSLTDFDDETLSRIFGTILDWHFQLKSNNFTQDVQKMAHKIIHGTQIIYKTAVSELLPTPMKSHYLFNLRDFAKVVFGVCMADKDTIQSPEDVTRLWVHEVWRIFGDRLVNDKDKQFLLELTSTTVTRQIGLNFDNVFQYLDKPDHDGNLDQKINTIDEIRGLIWTDVMTPPGALKRSYGEIRDYPALLQNIDQQLSAYNMMSESPMNLVMFNFAIEHLLIIARILKTPGGNALLVGVGGSGRQSQTKLASHVMDYQVFQIEISKLYGTTEWHDDIKLCMKKAGAAQPTVFLFTDSQIKQDSFVEDINNLLNSSEVPNLFTSEDKAEVQELVIRVSKDKGQPFEGTPQQSYQYFIEQVKENLHIVLAFSPIGDAFRTRVRKFPSLVNCCTIDWFTEWPEDALHSVAQKFISDIPLQEDIKVSCIDILKYFHSQTIIERQLFFQKLKRNYYVTPTSYIEMIVLFKQLLQQKREKVKSDETKYVNGYDKIISTEKTISEMQVVIEEMIPQLKQAQEDTEKKMIEVEQQKVEADKMEEVITAEQEIVQVAVNEANIIKSECEKALAEAMPALLAAEAALKVLDRKDIDVLKSMKNPPLPIKTTMQALCLILYPNPTEKKKNPETLKIEIDWWLASMKLLNNPKLLSDLIEYDKENMEEKIVLNLGKFIKDPENQKILDIKVVENASTACKCIIQWIEGIYSFYFVNKKVKPKKQNLKESESKVAGLNQQLAIKQAQLKKATDKVDNLNQELEQTNNKKITLETRYNDYTAQLQRAKLLIESLGGEKGRWYDLGQSLQQDYKKLTGDILVSAGLIAYLGAFTQAFRSKISADWVKICQEKQIPSSEVFSLQKILGDAVKIRQWNIQGLPSDEFSIQNSIIAFTSRRWPLFIDPQGQANKWIKKMEGEQLQIIKLSDPDYLRTLENAIQFGNPVLLENVAEDLDPSLTPILLKQTFKKGATTYLKVGDQLLEYQQNFKFYITTKYRNPHYLPEISTKVTLINFMITYEGLNDQLLGILVQKEKPELESEKERLILESADNKKQLFEIEEQILQVLQESKKILTDEKAINILTASKEKSNAISEQQKISEVTEKEIDFARQGYEPVSQEASCLFFAISDLVSIDPMYQYSLTYYIDLFSVSISQSDQSTNLEIRLKNLKHYFQYSLYSNICRSLFEKDKLLLSFLLCVRILEFQNQISNEDFRFLLTGGLGIDDNLPDKPEFTWISQKMWEEFCRLAKMPGYEQLHESIKETPDQWQQIYESQEPHKVPLPLNIRNNINSFQKLCILRVIRIDKLIPAITDFIVEKMGKRFIEPPPFDLANIYKDSNNVSPLIFILSPGSDPFVALNNFCQQKNKEITPISLGQGQGPAASKIIKDGQLTGNWVVLQNCHLAVSWMSTLEKIVEDFNDSNTHKEFRLWLTSYPSDKFPTSILQGGVKMTTEAPQGLKQNLIGSYNTDPISNPQFFDGCEQSKFFKRLCYGLCFFHAVIQERRKYGSLGWNIPYEFNESDLRISVRQLQMFLNEMDDSTIPFEALKYLTGECNYGGRVTDDKDRLLLTTLLEDYYNISVAKQSEYQVSEDSNYIIPNFDTFQQFVDSIKSLPMTTNPEILGFHQNADITKDINESNLLLDSLLITSSEGGSGDSGSSDELLRTLVDGVQMRQEFNIPEIQQKFPVLYEESMNTVLIQELTRYNKLIKVIRQSIKDMDMALQGKILMNQDLENASKSMLDGKVPQMWISKSYPSLKPLGSYVKDLKQRLEFFQIWVDEGIPRNFWLSGFYFTQSFLTGVLQNYARKYEISIDEIIFDFEILPAEPKFKPTDGASVWGLFIEGSKWNYEKMELDESDPKELFVKCPFIQLKPTHMNDIQQYQHYNCPVYKTSARRGVLSTTGHSTNFVMKIKLPTSLNQRHWIKRGVAMLTQLDD